MSLRKLVGVTAELVTDGRDAIANPELGVLSAVIHGRVRAARAVGAAAP